MNMTVAVPDVGLLRALWGAWTKHSEHATADRLRPQRFNQQLKHPDKNSQRQEREHTEPESEKYADGGSAVFVE
jgi:hypothetical protein